MGVTTVRVIHGIGDLADDLAAIAARVQPEMALVVEQLAADGLRIATASARRQSGTHGRFYPKAFSSERTGPLRWEYGPDVNKKQGGMAFEDGPGPQTRPHNNLRKSADAIGPAFPEEVGRRVDRWFW